MFNSLDTSSLFNFDQIIKRVALTANPEQTQPVINNSGNQGVDTFVLAEGQDQLPLRHRTVNELIVTLSHHTNVNVRREAAYSLQGTSPQAVAALITALRGDTDAEVRANAAYSLGHQRRGAASPQAVAALITALREDTDVAVRVAAAYELGYILANSGQTDENSRRASAALIRALDDPDASLRSTAATSLGYIGRRTPQAVAALIIVLSEDTSVEVRANAAYSLGIVGRGFAPAATTALITAIRNEGANEEVRNNAIISLCRIGLPNIGQGTDEQFRIFTDALRSDNKNISDTAHDALIRLGEASVPHIVEQFGNGMSSEKLIDMLVRIGPPAISNLVAALDHENFVVRANSAHALALIGRNLDLRENGNQERLNTIVGAISCLALLDPNREVRGSACNTLGFMRIRAEGALSVLEIIAENDSRQEVRRQAQAAIRMIRRN